jgi:hypothetical protein
MKMTGGKFTSTFKPRVQTIDYRSNGNWRSAVMQAPLAHGKDLSSRQSVATFEHLQRGGTLFVIWMI